MSEFVFKYFKQRFPSDQMAFEWCYNLNDACEKYLHNENIQFFKGVLNNQIDEQIYYHERHILSDLLTVLMDIETKEAKTDQPVCVPIDDCILNKKNLFYQRIQYHELAYRAR